MAAPTQPVDGFYFDELSKIRVLDPSAANNTENLRDECKDFVDKISSFQSLVGGFIEMVDLLARQVEEEKTKAIGARTHLQSIAKQREAQKRQIHSLIAEKKTQLERMRLEYESLQQIEKEQRDFIEDFG
ncbi:PREDICTED: intraflagellar transport protein 20 homolog [Amphimedon queenslandica]|uniref:Intraflagellar transport protein 20 homolog n=1 Tax=Amphimedon queenslandica TaxID=400682 RepID=A0A1X7UI96_AMPQE|nr:PREDICTED: intraflagellar transport protein 20 homolog [Amphimedon queenslandica]|eukprot:XP_003387910.1 PREDICTED: intraflagellar transport protein 20 homolog [Amphimedon queenslandica]